MKILFFIESLRSGGKERRLVELIKGLKNKHPSIEMELVLTREDIHYQEIFETGIKIRYAIRKYLKKDPRIFFKFYKIAKKFKPDIIHVWGNMVAVYAIPTKILIRIPIINNEITDAPIKVQQGLLSHKLTFPFSDRIIANSFAGLKSYNALEKKSIVIYNGFDFKRINNLTAKESIRVQFNINTKFVVGMVASYSVLKDYKTYLESANLILEKRKDVCFLCIGSGDYSAYKKLVATANVDKILFLGPQANVESIMNCCDIGVLASFAEGISNSLLELMALGKPIVVSGGGGSAELVIEGKSGFLIPSKDSDLLAEKINLLLNDEETRIEMGINAKQIVKNKFDIDRMVEEFYLEYKQLCAE